MREVPLRLLRTQIKNIKSNLTVKILILIGVLYHRSHIPHKTQLQHENQSQFMSIKCLFKDKLQYTKNILYNTE